MVSQLREIVEWGATQSTVSATVRECTPMAVDISVV